jgi:hypothetical protein
MMRIGAILATVEVFSQVYPGIDQSIYIQTKLGHYLSRVLKLQQLPSEE